MLFTSLVVLGSLLGLLYLHLKRKNQYWKSRGLVTPKPMLLFGLITHCAVDYLHRHPDHFPEPDEFRPERFLPDNRNNIKPYSYFPFGEGPRICIGQRFAKMQMMAGLVTLLRSYTVELPPHIPHKLDFDSLAFTLQAKQKVELKFLRRAVSSQ